MTCEQYAEWLHLHRPGELGEKEQRALEHHLAGCPRCSALRERIAAADRTLLPLRGPLIADPDIETAAAEILRNLVGANARPRPSIRTQLLDSLVMMFDRPRLRYAMAGLLGLLGGVLLYQQISVMIDVSRLEQRMALTPGRAGTLQSAFLVRSETLSRIPGSRQLLETLGGRMALDRNDNLLVTRDEARVLQRALARAILRDKRVREMIGRSRPMIEETVRVLRAKPNTAFRILTKGGA